MTPRQTRTEALIARRRLLADVSYRRARAARVRMVLRKFLRNLRQLDSIERGKQ